MKELSDQHIPKELTSRLHRLTPAQRFNALVKTAAAKSLPLAAWRLPGKSDPCLLIDLSGSASSFNPDLESMPPGFLLGPYEADLMAPGAAENPVCRFLAADIFYDQTHALQLAPRLSSYKQQRAEDLFEACVEGFHSEQLYPTAKAGPANTDQAQFMALVEKSVEAIQAGIFQKVVCARTKAIKLPQAFSLSGFFSKLCEAYPNAFVSLVSLPGIGTWVGASPEVLIAVTQERLFRTVALAGTQPRQAGMSTVEAVWRQKEIEEQALVSRYIINCFKKIRVREFDEIGPRTVAAANLLHLRTDFTVDLQQVNYPKLPTHMLQLLHPTSAVCGLPKAPAAQFLKEYEQLDRQLFAGFLGPVNLQQETNLFVNLRCVQLFSDSALLYAGAGITADSVAEREWQETEHKCQTLLHIFEQFE